MAFDAVRPVELSIKRLQESCRVSMESPSREILESARYGVNAAIGVLQFLSYISGGFWSETRKVLEGETKKALEEEIREATSGLEYVLDCHVSDQFLSQSETEDEGQPLLFFLDLQGIQKDVDGFKQKMKRLQKLFHDWEDVEDEDEDADERESFMEGLSDEPCGSRTRLIHRFASKAASIFLGMEAEYIQELDTLLPQEKEKEDEEDDEYYNYYINDAIMSWWAKKAASVYMMDREYIQELGNPLPEEEKDDCPVSWRTEFAENISKSMVGVTDVFYQVRDCLLKDSNEYQYTSICGMAGIGKTALAMKIFEDPFISSTFDSRIFVRIGPEYEIQNIVQAVLAQLNPDGGLNGYLHKSFKVRKILILLDDVWDRKLIYDIGRKLPPEEVCGCHFFLTTRLQLVATCDPCHTMHLMRFLNVKESWDLLQEKVFAGEKCPRELEKAGKQIADNCEGLPLLIITVADLLYKADKTLEYWTKVASSKKNSVFIDAYEKILEVLYPSYYYLSHDLKICFLYLGAFPQNCQIRLSKLINLWSAEGFDADESYNILLESVVSFFERLVWNSVTLDSQRSSYMYKLKACSLHSVFWYLSKKEAWNEKFFHILDSHADASVQDIGSRRRLSVYKNSIFSIKAVHHSIASISGVRSLLCTGPYHPYQVPICFGLRLLKVLDALSIRFYEFPVEVVKLVLLRYIALTCNRNLSPFISKLWTLQCLIVHQHLSIKSSISESYVPMEIWDLLELQYLQIMGRNLPDPPPGAVLTKLMILLDVGAHTCTKNVFKSIPNLNKLRVRIELMPDAAEPLGFFDEIFLLKELKLLQCVVVNPKFVSVVVAPAPLVSTSNLTRLTLSGLGYPWKDIQIIAELPHLLALKLRCYAFRGEKWQVTETQFRSLEYFLIEDTDLMEWTGGSKNFPELGCLIIKNCYKLQEIPRIPSVRNIQVVDCNPSIVTCAKPMAHKDCNFYVDSSWMESGNLKS